MNQMLATPTKQGILAELITRSKRIGFQFPKRSLAIVLALGLLPWLGVISFTAGSFAAIHFVCYAILIFAIGYSAISVLLPASSRPEMIVFAPSLGILTISALSALWLRLGLSIVWVPALWLVFLLPGAWNLWVDRALWGKTTIAYGWTLVLLSTLICLVYFLPSARRDAVLQHDGSFNWMYTDTQ